MGNNGFRIRSHITLEQLATAPAGAVNGDIFYDGTLNQFRKYENGAWGTLAATLLNTKGDILTRTASADARLGVGANGTVLTADSAETTGLKWASPGGSSLPTGVMMPYAGSTAPSGWVLSSGKTIGSGASGGTERANADTQTLFELLWTNYSNSILPITDSAGVPTTRGISAAADFAANKRMPVPDMRGRTAVGMDNLGGTSANRMTSGISGATMGASGGSQDHALSTAEMPSHTHTQNAHNHSATTNPAGGHSHTMTINGLAGQSTIYGDGAANTGDYDRYANGGGGNYGSISIDAVGNHSHSLLSDNTTATNQSAGSGTSHNNTQPGIIWGMILKL